MERFLNEITLGNSSFERISNCLKLFLNFELMTSLNEGICDVRRNLLCGIYCVRRNLHARARFGSVQGLLSSMVVRRFERNVRAVHLRRMSRQPQQFPQVRRLFQNLRDSRQRYRMAFHELFSFLLSFRLYTLVKKNILMRKKNTQLH